ncbi:MAG: hypothetical protein AAF721_26215 [Myxococcota bacterium]
MTLTRDLVLSAACVACTGCFEDSAPESAAETGASSGASDTTSGTTSAAAGTTSEPGSSDGVDVTGMEETGEPICVQIPAELFLRESDVVLGVDPTDLDLATVSMALATAGPALAAHEELLHLALIAPEGVEFDADCEMGCEDCIQDSPQSVQASPPTGLGEPLEVFLPGDPYACTLRPGDPMNAPALRSYVHVTTRPDENTEVPGPLAAEIEASEASYFVACPGCDQPDDADGVSALQELARQTNGGWTNLDNPDEVAFTIAFAAAPRIGCLWFPSPPAAYTIDDLSLHYSSTFLDVDLERVDTPEDCAPWDGGDPPLQWSILDASGEPVVALCEPMCFVSRLEPANAGLGELAGVAIAEEYCSNAG